jgi:type IV pilus secretin PilQ/predicted competence protein
MIVFAFLVTGTWVHAQDKRVYVSPKKVTKMYKKTNKKNIVHDFNVDNNQVGNNNTLLGQQGKGSQDTQNNPVMVDDVNSEGNMTFNSISDLAIEELVTTKGGGARNPFSPGVVDDELNPLSLIVQGIVIGDKAKYTLISGQIFSINDRIGYYTVKDIKPGRVVLSQLEDVYTLRMDGFSSLVGKRKSGSYYIEFYNSSIKKSLRLLAKSGGINIIIPENTSGKVTVAFNNTQVIDAVASILRVNELEYAFENDIMRVGEATQFKDDSDLKAVSVPLHYATAKELEDKVKTFLSDRGATTSDDRTNVIIVKDHANVINNVKKFLAAVDRKDPQVSIEAKIIDASKTFSRSLGIQWGLTSGPSNMIFRGNQDTGSITNGANTGSVVNLPAASPTSGIDILVGRLPGNLTLETQLSAAEANGTIRIISKPNVTTINNKTAKIRSGVKIYVKVDGGDDEGPQLQEIDTGIELKVTPQITLNRMVKMTIEAIQSEADFSRTVDNIPSILDNTASTTVLIPDGETAVIGGLLKVNTTMEKKSVPGISKVPVLGWLFKNTNKTKTNKELMIFITPKILDTDYYKISSKR